MYYMLVDKKPVAISSEEFMSSPWLMSIRARRIAETFISEVHISTVFLSIDHSWGDGPPVLFETMIFGGKHDNWQTRSTSYEGAMKNHVEAVEMVESSRIFKWLKNGIKKILEKIKSLYYVGPEKIEH